MADKNNPKVPKGPHTTTSLPPVCSFSRCNLIARTNKGTIDDSFYCLTHNRNFYFERVKLEQPKKKGK